MAASSAQSDIILNRIEEDFLTCPICLNQYVKARILPCLHTFCEGCLTALVAKTGRLVCPSCNSECTTDVTKLKNHFLMNNLVEVFESRQALVDGKPVNCDGCKKSAATHRCIECVKVLCDPCFICHGSLDIARGHRTFTLERYEELSSTNPTSLQPIVYCSTHHEQKLKYYCDMCDEAGCVECFLISHYGHGKPREIKEVAAEYTKELSKRVDELKVKSQSATSGKIAIENAVTDLDITYQEQEALVRRKSKEVISKVKKEETKLIEELYMEYMAKKKVLDSHKQAFDHMEKDLHSAQNYAETMIYYGNAAQLMSTKQEIKERINHLLSLDATPKTDIEMLTFVANRDELYGNYIGRLEKPACASKCIVGYVPDRMVQGANKEVTVTTKDSTGKRVTHQLITAKLKHPNGSLSKLFVTNNFDGTQTILLCTADVGRYILCLEVDGTLIPGSPFEIVVAKGQIKDLGEEGNEPGQLKYPQGVTLNNEGHVVIADTDNKRIQTMDLKLGQSQLTFSIAGQFKPLDIAVSKDNKYFITDSANSQVVVTCKLGELIHCFGSNELKDPMGISISPIEDAVFVTDCRENYIRKYKESGQYMCSFGGHGTRDGQFLGPCFIDCDKQGQVYVSDIGNNRIQVFNKNCQYMYSIGTGSQLTNPRGVATGEDNCVYVTDDSNQIHKFHRKGKFLGSINPGLNGPKGIVVTCNKGNSVVVVADSNNHRINVFE
ncbi:tripartite motif-containing protein 2-like [Saccoglossus kowalevskii]|uniref:Tripartite motif-containing protein 2-like n=1 Tax=Saccoglossus kowalevskii TaxID=10224 RepID=A0ABM0M1B3_SACKO|nr:PREDICTED: tripartite motif-containing protein 2-like [Saccoglossus kowalevskii]